MNEAPAKDQLLLVVAEEEHQPSTLCDKLRDTLRDALLWLLMIGGMSFISICISIIFFTPEEYWILEKYPWRCRFPTPNPRKPSTQYFLHCPSDQSSIDDNNCIVFGYASTTAYDTEMCSTNTQERWKEELESTIEEIRRITRPKIG